MDIRVSTVIRVQDCLRTLKSKVLFNVKKQYKLILIKKILRRGSSTAWGAIIHYRKGLRCSKDCDVKWDTILKDRFLSNQESEIVRNSDQPKKMHY